LRQLGEQLGEGGVLKNEEGEEIIDIREDIAEEYSAEFGGNNNSNNNNSTNDVLLSSSEDEFEDLMQEMEEIELEEEEEEEEEEENVNTTTSSNYTEKQPSKIYNGLKRGFLVGSGTTTASLYENTNGVPIDKTRRPPVKPTSMAKQQAAAFTGHVVERIISSNEGTAPAGPSRSKPVSKFKQRMGR
jgi:hypothetical protein